MRFIVTTLKEPCSICKRQTDLFSLDLDKRICSEECLKKSKEK